MCGRLHGVRICGLVQYGVLGGALYIADGGSGTISSCVLSNNYATAGGAIWSAADLLSITNSSLSSNQAVWTSGGEEAGSGGALYLTTAAHLAGSTFTNNSARQGYGGTAFVEKLSMIECSVYNSTALVGGAIHGISEAYISIALSKMEGNHALQNAGAVYSTGSVLVSQSTFLGNSAEQNGGAIAGGTGSNISTQTVKFVANKATNGGAIALDHARMASMTSCQFDGNQASMNGGALHNYAGANITDCKFNNNTAVGFGGAIIFREPNAINVESSVFQQNDALQGGGITILSGEFGAHDVLIINSAFQENTGYTQAGGLLVMLASALVTCRNVTFTHNHSPNGAAIAQVFLQATKQKSTLRLASCIIVELGMG